MPVVNLGTGIHNNTHPCDYLVLTGKYLVLTIQNRYEMFICHMCTLTPHPIEHSHCSHTHPPSPMTSYTILCKTGLISYVRQPPIHAMHAEGSNENEGVGGGCLRRRPPSTSHRSLCFIINTVYQIQSKMLKIRKQIHTHTHAHLPWHSRVHRFVHGRHGLFTGILPLSPEPDPFLLSLIHI